MYVFNLAVAMIGTKVAEDPFDHFVHFSDRSKAALLKGDFLTVCMAFVLGYFVYYKWHLTSAKWVWVAGVSLFGLRAFGVLGGPPGTLLWEVSKSSAVLSIDIFNDWVYTTALLRTIAYSTGAFSCSRVGSALRTVSRPLLLRPTVRGSCSISSVKPRTVAPSNTLTLTFY